MIQDKLNLTIGLCAMILLGFQPLLGQKDSLFLFFDQDENPYFLHTLLKKQTLFSLTNLYEMDMEAIQVANPKLGTKIKEGSKIIIPFNDDLIEYEPDLQSNYKALYYRCKKEDRLFHLINRELDLSWKKTKKLNPLIEDKEHFPNVILLGFVKINNAIAEKEISVNEIPKSKRNNNENEQELNIELPDKPEPGYSEIEAQELHFKNTKRGLAYCEKSFDAKGRFYALHAKAAINSTIELSNPITGRRVFAKVVGRIPKVYARDADVIVSSEVAKELGSYDRRFFIEVKY